MRTKLKNHREVAHVWASRNQDYGECSTMSFRGDSIYSYHWWEMARFMEVKGQKIVLIRDWSYSNSTSKHLNYVRGALRGLDYKMVHCYGTTGRDGSIIDHKLSVQQFLNEMYDTTVKFKRSKNPEYWLNQNARLKDAIARYCELFDIPFPDKANEYFIDPDDVVYFIEARKQRNIELEKTANERAEKRRQIQLKKYEEKIAEFNTHEQRWMDGENVSTEFNMPMPGCNKYSHETLQFSQTRMRLKNGMVETSEGAYVPEREALILWYLIRDGRDIKGHRVGSYTVIGINGTLKIGCHEISREEIERFVKKYNW